MDLSADVGIEHTYPLRASGMTASHVGDTIPSFRCSAQSTQSRTQ